MTTHTDLIERGAADEAVWDEIGRAFERRRHQVETEVRRKQVAREYMTAEEALLFASVLVGAVREHVPDAGARARIAAVIDHFGGSMEVDA
jgi:hypothetical protein